MRQKSETPKVSSEQIVKDIRRATRKHYSAEDKIRIVLDGLRGEYSIAELCRREGIAESLYYSWSNRAHCCAPLRRNPSPAVSLIDENTLARVRHSVPETCHRGLMARSRPQQRL
jgi:transposase-like protein